MVLTTRQKILQGIREIVSGIQQRDERRYTQGLAVVEMALDSIPAPAIDPNLLWELNRSGTEMLEYIPEMLDDQTMRNYLMARAKFQEALARVREVK